MSNLSDAHQLLNENSTVYDNNLTGFENMCKLYSDAKQAVEIASKTDWNYNLSEMKNNELYPVVLTKSEKTILGYKNEYGTFNKDGSGIRIKAFCELPVFH